jgi:hypothetical protein
MNIAIETFKLQEQLFYFHVYLDIVDICYIVLPIL